MYITTRHYCDNCHREIDTSRELKRLNDSFKIEKRLCKDCIIRRDFEVK